MGSFPLVPRIRLTKDASIEGSYPATAGDPFLVIVVVLCGFALRPGWLPSIAVAAATIALLAVPTFQKHQSTILTRVPLDRLLLFGIALFALISLSGWPPTFIGPTTAALEVLPIIVWAGLAALTYLGSSSELRRRTVFAMVLVTTLIVGVLHIRQTGGLGIDVLALHVEAAEALESGLNPYTDAVSVSDGSPLAAEGATIDGYVYPPTTALLYAVGEWTLADPRFVSLFTWLGFLALLGSSAVRRDQRTGLLTMILLASAPGWPFVLRAAWTEPASLLLFAAAQHAWRRPVVSGIWAGLALGSKQYFAVTAPLVARFRGTAWKKRAAATVASIGLPIALAVAWGPDAFWNAAVEFHLATPPRPDSLNLVGLAADLNLNVSFPSLLPIVVGLGVSYLMARRASTASDYMLVVAASLAASFLVSSQAFPNYWFLIMGLAGLALAARSVTPDGGRP